MNIKNFVKDNNQAFFEFYRHGELYYTVRDQSTNKDYLFPVPISDIGDAKFLKQDKAMLFMRYIRKAMENELLVPFNKV